MLRVIAVSSPSFAKSPLLLGELKKLGCEVVTHQKGSELDEAELSKFFEESNAEIAIIGREILTPRVLDRAKNLKFLAKYGVGLDNLDPKELEKRGIALGWTPGVNRRAVAELVMAFIIGHLRNVFLSVDRSRGGHWIKDGGLSLSSRTIGIVGFGCVGSDLSKILQIFGSKILYTDIVDRTEEARGTGAQRVSLEQLLSQSDVVSLHVPLNGQTCGMIGHQELKMMKSSALLVNTSRGLVVNFEQACEAVKQGKLGGYAADVFPEEPMDLKRWVHPHLYFTPHIGGNSREAVLAMGRSAIDHVKKFIAMG